MITHLDRDGDVFRAVPFRPDQEAAPGRADKHGLLVAVTQRDEYTDITHDASVVVPLDVLRNLLHQAEGTQADGKGTATHTLRTGDFIYRREGVTTRAFVVTSPVPDKHGLIQVAFSSARKAGGLSTLRIAPSFFQLRDLPTTTLRAAQTKDNQ